MVTSIQANLTFALSEQDTVGGRIQGQELIGKIGGGYKASLKAFWRNRTQAKMALLKDSRIRSLR